MNLEQVMQFTGLSGTLTFTPDSSVDATLDDGTRVQFARVFGRYDVSPDDVRIAFEKPFPLVTVHKFFLQICADVRDFQYSPPANLTVGTSKGRYRISLEKLQ